MCLIAHHQLCVLCPVKWKGEEIPPSGAYRGVFAAVGWMMCSPRAQVRWAARPKGAEVGQWFPRHSPNIYPKLEGTFLAPIMP